MTSAPAARTFWTSSPRRAKSAERMEGAITYLFGSHDMMLVGLAVPVGFVKG